VGPERSRPAAGRGSDPRSTTDGGSAEGGGAVDGRVAAAPQSGPTRTRRPPTGVVIPGGVGRDDAGWGRLLPSRGRVGLPPGPPPGPRRRTRPLRRAGGPAGRRHLDRLRPAEARGGRGRPGAPRHALDGLPPRVAPRDAGAGSPVSLASLPRDLRAVFGDRTLRLRGGRRRPPAPRPHDPGPGRDRDRVRVPGARGRGRRPRGRRRRRRRPLAARPRHPRRPGRRRPATAVALAFPSARPAASPARSSSTRSGTPPARRSPASRSSPAATRSSCSPARARPTSTAERPRRATPPGRPGSRSGSRFGSSSGPRPSSGAGTLPAQSTRFSHSPVPRRAS
jgi:hypothetical protein